MDKTARAALAGEQSRGILINGGRSRTSLALYLGNIYRHKVLVGKMFLQSRQPHQARRELIYYLLSKVKRSMYE